MSKPSATYERHSSLYFPDGDIALSAKTATGVSQVFRIDRILLSRHSEVFRDMLMVSSDERSANEMYDGVPLVSLPADDSAEDVENLLEVVYDPGVLLAKFSSKRRADIPAAVTGLMRMAQKYIVLDIEDAIIEGIICMWPKTLAEWDVKAFELEAVLLSPEASYMDPVSIIHFFRKYGKQALIPLSVFYQLSVTPTGSHWQQPMAKPEVSSSHAPKQLSAQWSLLDGREAMMCFEGRDGIRTFASRPITSLMSCQNYYGGGHNKTACQPALHNLERTYFQPWYTQTELDILKLLRLLAENARKHRLGKSMCERCAERIGPAADKLRAEIWEDLPTFFPVSSLTTI